MATPAIFDVPAFRPERKNLLVARSGSVSSLLILTVPNAPVLFSARLRVAQQIINVYLRHCDCLHFLFRLPVLDAELLFFRKLPAFLFE